MAVLAVVGASGALAPVRAAAAPPPTVASQRAGTLPIGGRVTVASCGLAPGEVRVTVNDGPAASDIAGADGCGHTSVLVVSPAQVRVEAGAFPARCGRDANTLTVSGRAPGGTSRVVHTVFGIACPASANGRLPHTEAQVLRWSLLAGTLLAVAALVLLAERRHPKARRPEG